jgi:hypothetical protein
VSELTVVYREGSNRRAKVDLPVEGGATRSTISCRSAGANRVGQGGGWTGCVTSREYTERQVGR